MGYEIRVSCDKCGKSRSYDDPRMSRTQAVKIHRWMGWTIGKNGWFCKECKVIRAE